MGDGPWDGNHMWCVSQLIRDILAANAQLCQPLIWCLEKYGASNLTRHFLMSLGPSLLGRGGEVLVIVLRGLALG